MERKSSLKTWLLVVLVTVSIIMSALASYQLYLMWGTVASTSGPSAQPYDSSRPQLYQGKPVIEAGKLRKEILEMQDTIKSNLVRLKEQKDRLQPSDYERLKFSAESVLENVPSLLQQAADANGNGAKLYFAERKLEQYNMVNLIMSSVLE